MNALSDERRGQLMRLSLMVVCAGTAVLPFTVPPTSGSARAQGLPRPATISVPDVPGRLKFPAIFVERDPFVADEDGMPVDLSRNIAEADDERSGAIGIVLPPNAGAQGQSPDASGGAPIVRGIVLGDAPQALVDVGNGVNVYTVGDQIGNDRIRSIDAGGIVLSSGVRLAIVHEKQ